MKVIINSFLNIKKKKKKKNPLNWFLKVTEIYEFTDWIDGYSMFGGLLIHVVLLQGLLESEVMLGRPCACLDISLLT